MNNLKHIADFRSALADYRPSDAAKQILRDTRLVLLVGPTSAGRNTIIDKLVKTGLFHYIVSDTTREPRTNNGVLEQNGREYWFRSEETMLDELRKGEFLEAAIIHNQQVSGISIRELEKARQAEQIAINEVETDGAANIHRLKPDTLIIFVVPPDFKGWLARFAARGPLPPDELHRRLESSCKEFTAALENDYYIFMVNEHLDESVQQIADLAANGARDFTKEQIARATVERLLKDAQAYLQQ